MMIVTGTYTLTETIVLSPGHMVVLTSLPPLETVMPMRLALATGTGALSEIIGLYSNSIFHIVRRCHTVLHSGDHTTLHSYQ